MVNIIHVGSLGFIFLTLLSGIMTLQPTSQPRTKEHGLARHQIAMALLGFPSIALGSMFMIYNKTTHGSNHFTTWHAVSLHYPAGHFGSKSSRNLDLWQLYGYFCKPSLALSARGLGLPLPRPSTNITGNVILAFT